MFLTYIFAIHVAANSAGAITGMLDVLWQEGNLQRKYFVFEVMFSHRIWSLDSNKALTQCLQRHRKWIVINNQHVTDWEGGGGIKQYLRHS